jgi:hypothetical protein
VPLFDPGTGEVGELPGPPYNSPQAAAFWKPVLDACRERLKKRGMDDESIVIGLCGDTEPDRETVDMFHEAAPWAKWAGQAHRGVYGLRGNKVSTVANYGGKVWVSKIPDPAKERRFGWQVGVQGRPRIFTVFPRAGAPLVLRSETNLAGHWIFQETYMLIGLRGASRIGAEFWPVVGDSKSRMATLVNLYDSPVPTMNCSVIDLLAPGPDGAVSTARLETLYEGSQEAEARAFIEKAMQAKGDKLAIGGSQPDAMRQMLQDLLDERPRLLNAYGDLTPWYVGSGWEARSERLYDAASQVSKAR